MPYPIAYISLRRAWEQEHKKNKLLEEENANLKEENKALKEDIAKLQYYVDREEGE